MRRAGSSSTRLGDIKIATAWRRSSLLDCAPGAPRRASHFALFHPLRSARKKESHSEPLAARNAFNRAALPRWRPLSCSGRAVALRLRTRSIARSHARTIVTCPKSALPCALAPQLVGAEVAHDPTAPGPAGVDATSSSPTQMPTAEDPENKKGGTPTDYVFRGPRPPAPHLSTAYSRYRGVAAFESGCRPDKLGGFLCCRASTFVLCAPSFTPSIRKKGCLQGSSYRTHVQYRVLRRVYDRESGFLERRTITRFLRRQSPNDSTAHLPLGRCRRNSVARNRGPRTQPMGIVRREERRRPQISASRSGRAASVIGASRRGERGEGIS